MIVVSRTGRLLRRLVRVACARPRLTVLIAVALAGVSVWYTLTTLTFATSNRALLPQWEPYVQKYIEYDAEFGQLDDLVIVVEAPSFPEAKAYAARLVREAQQRKVPLNRIAYRIDPRQFEGRALLFLSKERLVEIRDKIFDYQDFMETFAARPTLDQFVDGLATQVATAFAGSFLDLGLEDVKGKADLRFIEDLVGQISARLDRPTPYRSPWGSLFALGDDDTGTRGYFVSDDERMLFVLAEPQSDTGTFTDDRRAIEGIRAVVAALRTEFPRVRVGVTGKPALSNDEMTAAFRDSERATILAFALTLGLLLAAFLRVIKPLLMLAVLALSLCWSLGVATLVIGHLSLFSVMFISIVIGLGIDYGIYYLFRYEEELFLGRRLSEAIEITAARAGPGMLLGAATAAGAFYVLMLTAFPGLRELGFIAGTAIVLAWLAMMTVFPATLVLVDRRHANTMARPAPRALALEHMHVPLVDRMVRYPKTVLAVMVLLTVVTGWTARAVRFDYNLLNLQADGTESVEWEKRLLSRAKRSGFDALASADSVDELRRKHEAFDRLATVSEVDSAAMLLPQDQAEKQKIIGDFAPLVLPIRIARPLPLDAPALATALGTLGRRIGIAAGEAPAGEAKTRLGKLAARIERLVIKVRQADPATRDAALGHLQYQVYEDFVRSFQRLQSNVPSRPVGLADLPEEIRRKFVSDKGRFLLQIHPAVDIWDREGAAAFVTDLRRVDPQVTGTAVITYEAIRLMESAYRQGTIYALGLVALITGLTLRRWRETILALVPLGLGLLWTIGLMVILRQQFTMGNVFALPLLLGAGAEYGVNVILRFVEGQARDQDGPLIARSTVMGVLVAGLTTIVGFGSLMLAAHRGIFGLGLLLTLGTVMILLASLVALPVLLGITRRVRQMRRQARTATASRNARSPA